MQTKRLAAVADAFASTTGSGTEITREEEAALLEKLGRSIEERAVALAAWGPVGESGEQTMPYFEFCLKLLLAEEILPDALDTDKRGRAETVVARERERATLPGACGASVPPWCPCGLAFPIPSAHPRYMRTPSRS